MMSSLNQKKKNPLPSVIFQPLVENRKRSSKHPFLVLINNLVLFISITRGNSTALRKSDGSMMVSNICIAKDTEHLH